MERTGLKEEKATVRTSTAGKATNKSGGYAYLAFLIIIASVALMASALGLIVYSREVRMEKEQELIFRGLAYKTAIKSYYNASKGSRQLPHSLNDLVLDPRFPFKKHIRRLYMDPITGKMWTLIMASSGGIAGVASSSKTRPLKMKNFPVKLKKFEDAEHYSDWIFTYTN
jgi:type II secretory pathway pseudopilin PulG